MEAGSFSALVQTLGVPVAMLVIAIVTILNYFINGKVVPRWTYDAAIQTRDVIIAERNTTITAQTTELIEARKLIYSFANAAERGANALKKSMPP